MVREARAHWPLPVVAIACAVAIAGLGAAPAAAFHIPGASYGGTVSGGGSITFSVSRDGKSVTNLTLTNLHSVTCSQSSAQYPQPVPITKNTFNNGAVSGSFPNVQGARGRFDITVSTLLPSCRITGTWSAITTADPRGSQECKTAQAHVKKWKRARRRAKRLGSPGKLRKAQGKWLKARAKRDQYC
jgi:hypothetical protein